jgi:hypothetical protein
LTVLSIIARAFAVSLLALVLGVGLGRAVPAAITSPVGGESWAVGSSHVITWESAGQEGEVRLALSVDNGATWTVMADKALDSGSFVWKVPDHVSKACKIRVGDAESRTFAIIPSQEVSAYRWVKVTMQAPFAPRDGAGALVYDDRLWLLGGWNPTDKQHFPRITSNDVWSSEDGAHWTLVKPNTFLDQSFDAKRDWEGRHTAGYVVYRGKMWIVGGDANQGHYQNDVWNSGDGKTWTRVSRTVPWSPRVLHYTLAFQDKIWVMGGQTLPQFAPAEERFYRDIWTTTDGVTWEKIEPKEPYWSARGEIGGRAVFHGRIWILGGGTYDTPTTPLRKLYNDVWSSADGIHWTRHLESAPWAPRQYHDVAVFDNRLWVLEGFNRHLNGNCNDVWYSADGVNWYEVPATPWKPRHAASVFVFRDALWMVAGNNMESDVWKLVRTTR